MQGDRLCHIFTWKNVGFSNSSTTYHHLIVVLIVSRKLIQIKMAISQVHNVMEAFFADGSEIFWCFELGLIYDEVHQDFSFMLNIEFILIDGIGCMADDVLMT